MYVTALPHVRIACLFFLLTLLKYEECIIVLFMPGLSIQWPKYFHSFRDAGPKCPVDNEPLHESQVTRSLVLI